MSFVSYKIVPFLASLTVIAILTSCRWHYQPLAVHYDEFGIAHIKGGTLEEVWHAIGYTVAKDALFQLFLYVQEANGKLSSLFGKDFVESDMLQLSLCYDNKELLDQFFALSDQTQKNFNAWAQGINQRIHEVNAQPLIPYEFNVLNIPVIPEFSVPDLLRTAILLSQEFVDASVPFFQLKNYVTAMKLIETANNVSTGLAMFNDLVPSYVKTKNTIVPTDGKKSYISFDTTTASVSAIDKEIAHQIEKLLALIEKNKKAKLARGISHKLGSYGVVIGKEKSATGNILMLAGPQMNFNFPDDLLEIHVDSPYADFKAHFFTVPGMPLIPLGVFQNYMSTLQVAFDVAANDFLIEPASNKKFFKRVIIEIKGDSPHELDIYRSTSGGWVIRSLTNDTILTLHSVFFGKQLRFLDGFMKSAHAKSWQEYFTIMSDPRNSSDLMLFLSQYADKNTIAALHLGLWTQLPSSVDRRFPLGTPFNPTTHYDDSVIQKPLYDINTAQGFYASWNNPFRSDLPLLTSGVPNRGNKVYWILNYLTSKKIISFDDLHKLISHIARANFLSVSSGQLDYGNNYGADLFVPFFKDKFFEIIHKNPTPERLQALKLLQDYDGSWLLPDAEVTSSLDINDQWILANQWLLLVLQKMFKDFVPSCVFESSCSTLHNSATTVTLLNLTNALARIIGSDPYDTIRHYDWPGLQNIETIVSTALDESLQKLGDIPKRPWGKNKRPYHTYKNPILGTVHKSLEGNRASVNFIGEISSDGIIRFEACKPLGQSGTVLGTPPHPHFDNHCFDQAPLFEAMKLRKILINKSR